MKRRPNGAGSEAYLNSSNGRWEVKVTDPETGKRRSLSAKTQAEVEHKRDAFRLGRAVFLNRSKITPERRRDLTRLSNRTGLYLVPSEDGHVYFIGAENGLVKIGHAVDVYNRFSKHQVGSPLPLKLIAAVPAKRSVEQALHVLNADRWSHGEWFRITEDEARAYAARCVTDVLGLLDEAARAAGKEESA